MNWYLETKLFHGTTDRYGLKESFIFNISFEDGFHCINDALQETQSSNFEPMTWVQTYAIKLYNMTTEEGEEYLHNINIHELEGQHKVAGSEVEIPGITQPVKMKQINIG